MTDTPLKADPAMFSDCGDAPCPEPVVAAQSQADPVVLMDGVRMRDNPAEWAFVRLSKMIEDFESRLDKDEEIGARLVGLPGDGIMQIEDIGFWGPDMIMFMGRNGDGKPMRADPALCPDECGAERRDQTRGAPGAPYRLSAQRTGRKDQSGGGNRRAADGDASCIAASPSGARRQSDYSLIRASRPSRSRGSGCR